MLATYRTNTQNLLQLPQAPSPLYSTANIDRWINLARGQLAGEAECIRVRGTVALVIDQNVYPFSSINIGTPATTGAAGVIHVRNIHLGVGTGQQWLTPRPWSWFSFYHLNNVNPISSVPETWAQYGQGAQAPTGGSSASGSFYLDPAPNDTYTVTCDCVCYPITLVDDASVEAIPYLWTDAVPFFASYYALLSAQTSARMADAERMFGYYKTFLERARQSSNPNTLRWQYEQATDPTQMNKIGLKPQQLAGAGGD